jgi:hypothetical protein
MKMVIAITIFNENGNCAYHGEERKLKKPKYYNIIRIGNND